MYAESVRQQKVGYIMARKQVAVVQQDELQVDTTKGTIETDATVVVSVETAQEEELKELAVIEQSLDEQLKLSEEALVLKYGNKSNAIRALGAMGAKSGPISRALNIRFQHARNVLAKPLKRVIKAERDAAQAAQADKE